MKSVICVDICGHLFGFYWASIMSDCHYVQHTLQIHFIQTLLVSYCLIWYILYTTWIMMVNILAIQKYKRWSYLKEEGRQPAITACDPLDSAQSAFWHWFRFIKSKYMTLTFWTTTMTMYCAILYLLLISFLWYCGTTKLVTSCNE